MSDEEMVSPEVVAKKAKLKAEVEKPAAAEARKEDERLHSIAQQNLAATEKAQAAKLARYEERRTRFVAALDKAIEPFATKLAQLYADAREVIDQLDAFAAETRAGEYREICEDGREAGARDYGLVSFDRVIEDRITERILDAMLSVPERTDDKDKRSALPSIQPAFWLRHDSAAKDRADRPRRQAEDRERDALQKQYAEEREREMFVHPVGRRASFANMSRKYVGRQLQREAAAAAAAEAEPPEPAA